MYSFTFTMRKLKQSICSERWRRLKNGNAPAFPAFGTTNIPITNICSVSLSQCESESNQLVLGDGKETEEELFLQWVDIELVLYRGNGRFLPLVARRRISIGRLQLVVASVRDATCSAIYEVSDPIGVAQLVFFLFVEREYGYIRITSRHAYNINKIILFKDIHFINTNNWYYFKSFGFEFVAKLQSSITELLQLNYSLGEGYDGLENITCFMD